MRPVKVFLAFTLAIALAASAAVAQQLSGPPRFITSQTSVALTATLVAPSRPTRLGVRIAMGTGTNQVYCGPNNGVTAANGYPIPPTAFTGAIHFETAAEVWCIALVGAQTVAVLENY